jgi:hypothetical protein
LHIPPQCIPRRGGQPNLLFRIHLLHIVDISNSPSSTTIAQQSRSHDVVKLHPRPSRIAHDCLGPFPNGASLFHNSKELDFLRKSTHHMGDSHTLNGDISSRSSRENPRRLVHHLADRQSLHFRLGLSSRSKVHRSALVGWWPGCDLEYSAQHADRPLSSHINTTTPWSHRWCFFRSFTVEHVFLCSWVYFAVVGILESGLWKIAPCDYKYSGIQLSVAWDIQLVYI